MKVFLAAFVVFLCMVGGVVLYGKTIQNDILGLQEKAQRQWVEVHASYLAQNKLLSSYIEIIKADNKIDKVKLTDLVVGLKHSTEDMTQANKAMMFDKIRVRDFEKMQSYLNTYYQEALLTFKDEASLVGNQEIEAIKSQLELLPQRLKEKKQVYNDLATEYNIRILKFPTAIVAMMFQFDRLELFKLE